MADYGSSPNNFLECVPSYVHAVAALQAGNTWMLRETAGVLLAAAGAGKTPLSSHFYTTNDHFTKTGSGQT